MRTTGAGRDSTTANTHKQTKQNIHASAYMRTRQVRMHSISANTPSLPKPSKIELHTCAQQVRPDSTTTNTQKQTNHTHSHPPMPAKQAR
jgi:hypothetical protein